VDTSRAGQPSIDATAQLARLQGFLTLPRETIPRLTVRDAGVLLRSTASRLGLEFIETSGVTPTFLLLPRGESAPIATLFGTWHSDPAPHLKAAVDGAERLALGATLAAVEAVAAAGALGPPDAPRVALLASPAAGAGSQGLDQLLREHRSRLQANCAFWIRIIPEAPRRRRIFLGSRGRLVVALRGGEANPYGVRDLIVAELKDSAYGPRPLDMELIRKLAPNQEDPDEGRLKSALFDPRGDVVIPAVQNPDRPRAWLTIEIAEAMEPEAVLSRIESLSAGGHADLVERFPWDRANIHHPAVRSQIELAKMKSEGPEIWPSSPWPSPSGLFTRALGSGLFEWGVPLPPGAVFRLPKPQEFHSIASEIAELLMIASSCQEEE